MTRFTFQNTIITAALVVLLGITAATPASAQLKAKEAFNALSAGGKTVAGPGINQVVVSAPFDVIDNNGGSGVNMCFTAILTSGAGVTVNLKAAGGAVVGAKTVTAQQVSGTVCADAVAVVNLECSIAGANCILAWRADEK